MCGVQQLICTSQKWNCVFCICIKWNWMDIMCVRYFFFHSIPHLEQWPFVSYTHTHSALHFAFLLFSSSSSAVFFSSSFVLFFCVFSVASDSFEYFFFPIFCVCKRARVCVCVCFFYILNRTLYRIYIVHTHNSTPHQPSFTVQFCFIVGKVFFFVFFLFLLTLLCFASTFPHSFI